MTRFVHQLLDGALSLLFPPRCEVCDTLQEPVVCERCRARFVPITPPYCEICGVPFDPLARGDACCAECREAPPLFDAARAGGVYTDELRHAIHQFKYGGIRALAGPLAAFIAETVTLPFPVQCICPVPLHPERERMRGYNQSGLLADALAPHWGLSVEPAWLTRIKNTTPQMQLPPEERKQNIKGAFAAHAVPAGSALLLLDDVYTTGSTLRECARVLRQAGASAILVITLARVCVGTSRATGQVDAASSSREWAASERGSGGSVP